MTFEVFVPGEGLAAVGAEDHGCGVVLAAASVGSTQSGEMKSNHRSTTGSLEEGQETAASKYTTQDRRQQQRVVDGREAQGDGRARCVMAGERAGWSVVGGAAWCGSELVGRSVETKGGRDDDWQNDGTKKRQVQEVCVGACGGSRADDQSNP